MAGEGRKEEREKEKEAGLGASVDRGCKGNLSLGTPFRVSKKSGPQFWGRGGGGAAAQGELSTGYPYTRIHRSLATLTQAYTSCHLQCLPHQAPHSSHGTWAVQEFFHSLPRDCILQQRPHPPLQGTRTPAGSALVCLLPSSPGAHS